MRKHYKYVPYAFGAFCTVIGVSAFLTWQKAKDTAAADAAIAAAKPQVKEGLYNLNPCGNAVNCQACANRSGCGWCSDVNICMPMARDGFPQRRPSEDNLPACSFLSFRSPREQKLCDTMTQMVTDQRPVCNPFAFVIDPRKC
jgi:hypothetical protein